MVDTIGLANAVGTSPTYNGRQLRQLNAIALAGATTARPLGALTGVRPGTPATTVTATSGTWTCGEFAGVADLMVAGESGPYPFAFDAIATGAMTPADSNNPRVDIVYVQIIDPEDGTTPPSATRKYLAGQAAASPTAPAAPAGAFTIAQINVPKVGAGSPSVTWVAPTVVAAGGIVSVPTLAALSLITGAPSQYADVVNDGVNNGLYRWVGSSWVSWNAIDARNTTTKSNTPALRAGSVIGTTSGGGDLSVTFPTPFPNRIWIVTPIDTNAGAGIGSIDWKVVSSSATGCVFRAINTSGNPITGFATSVGYIAVGE